MFVPLQAFVGHWSRVTMQVSQNWTRTNHRGMSLWRHRLWVTALSADCRADYHPIPSMGRPVIGLIRLTIKDHTIVGGVGGLTGPGFGLSGTGRDGEEMFISSASEVTTDVETWCGEGWSDSRNVQFILGRCFSFLVFIFLLKRTREKHKNDIFSS